MADEFDAVLDIVVVVSSCAVPFAVAYWALWPWVFGGSIGSGGGVAASRGRSSVRVLFAVVFALCMNMLLLALYEILDVLEPNTRLLTWRLVLLVLIVVLVLIVPLHLIYTLTTDTGRLHPNTARLLSVAGELVFMYLFWQAGSMFPLQAPTASNLALSSFDAFMGAMVGRLGVVGITTSAILSGYGVVASPYNSITDLLTEVSEADIHHLQAAVHDLLAHIFRKKTELARTEVEYDAAMHGQRPQTAVFTTSGQAEGWDSVPPQPPLVPPHRSTASATGTDGLLSPPTVSFATLTSGSYAHDNGDNGSATTTREGDSWMVAMGTTATHVDGPAAPPAPCGPPRVMSTRRLVLMRRRSSDEEDNELPATHPTGASSHAGAIVVTGSGNGAMAHNGDGSSTPGAPGGGDRPSLIMRPRAPTDVSKGTTVGAALTDMLGVFGLGARHDNSSTQQLQRQIKRLMDEVRVQEDMAQDLMQDLETKLYIRSRKRQARTCWGSMVNILGYVMLVYGVIQIVGGLRKIVFRLDPTKDTVTTLFEYALWVFRIPDAHLLVQPVSFLLVSIIVVQSTRSFLLNVSRTFAAMAHSVTANSVVLLLAEVMGAYFVSFILTLRMAMPTEYRRGITRAVGDIQFNVLHRWSDVMFILSASAAITLFAITHWLSNSRVVAVPHHLRLGAGAGGVDAVGARDDDEPPTPETMRRLRHGDGGDDGAVGPDTPGAIRKRGVVRGGVSIQPGATAMVDRVGNGGEANAGAGRGKAARLLT